MSNVNKLTLNVTLDINYNSDVYVDDVEVIETFQNYIEETLLDCVENELPADEAYGVMGINMGPERRVPINLNHMDSEGNLADTTLEKLTVNQISDIIDHAIQLVQIKRKGDSGQEQQVTDELEEALKSAELL